MAKAKTKKAAPKAKAPAKKAAPAKAPAKAKATPAKAKATPAKPAKPARDLVSAERIEVPMLAARPHLSDALREAFRSQCSEARAQELGAETKSGSVLAQARKWCVQIDATLARVEPGQVVRYSPERLTWLLECVNDLAEIIDAESGGKSGAASASTSVDVALVRGRAVRNDLLLALGEVADGSDALEAELAEARGGRDTAAEVLASVRALADLGTRWASSFDPTLNALVKSVGLGQPDLGRARDAADALASAMAGKTTTAAARRSGDSTAVNRVEGRVLFEMGKALTPLHDAADRGIGARLVADARVMAALGIRKGKPARGGAPAEAGGGAPTAPQRGKPATPPNEAGPA